MTRSKFDGILKALSIAGIVLGGAVKILGALSRSNESSSIDEVDLYQDCIWHCDFCDAIMNEQPGFTTACGTWTCAVCGALNDVSDDNIVPYGVEEITPHPLKEPEDEEMRLKYDPSYEGFDPEDL